MCQFISSTRFSTFMWPPFYWSKIYNVYYPFDAFSQEHLPIFVHITERTEWASTHPSFAASIIIDCPHFFTPLNANQIQRGRRKLPGRDLLNAYRYMCDWWWSCNHSSDAKLGESNMREGVKIIRFLANLPNLPRTDHKRGTVQSQGWLSIWL